MEEYQSKKTCDVMLSRIAGFFVLFLWRRYFVNWIDGRFELEIIPK